MNTPVVTYRQGIVSREEPPTIERALEVLAAPFSESPAEDLAAMRTCLPTLGETSASHVQYHRLLELAFVRLQKLTLELKPRLREAVLPLPKEIRQISRDLSSAYKAIAAGYRWVLAHLDPQAAPASVPAEPAKVMGRALKCLAEQIEIAALVAAPQPGGVWHSAYQLYMDLPREGMADAGPGPNGTQVFREMLAFSACQPEGLSAEEVERVTEYLRLFGSMVNVSETPAHRESPDAPTHWVDLGNDHPPHAISRRPPPPGAGRILYFSCARLASVADGHVRALENGFQPSDLRLPADAASPVYLALLKRLRQVWTEAPKRVHTRRRSGYMLQLCPGFDNFWRLLEQADEGMPVLDVGSTSDWAVVNESPSGYALMHSAGDVSGLENGSMVAVRNKAGQPWEVCIVRWMTSENPEHIEIGLQMISLGAKPIRLAFRDVKSLHLSPGLLLAPMPALRANNAILTVAGTCLSKRFVMVSGNKKTYTAQGNLVSVDMQTSHIELFQFEHDPYPV